MSPSIAVGIDCGDLDFRVVYWNETLGRGVPLSLPPGPLLFFDSRANVAGLGVGFPCLARSVGSVLSFQYQGRQETPASLLTARLAGARQSLFEATGQPPGPTVLAVPAALGHARRQALLACGRSAGYEHLCLLDRAVAAGLGVQAGRDASTTTVVFDLDYGEGEYALLRLGKGRCRVLGGGLTAPLSGEVLDAIVMEAVILALRRDRIFLGLKDFPPESWMIFRQAAENARRALGSGLPVDISLPPEHTRRVEPVQVRLSAAGLAARVRPLLKPVVQGVQEALEQNQLELADIDDFVATGAAAQTSPVWELLLEAFDRRPRRGSGDLVASGAVWLARHRPDEEVPSVTVRGWAPATEPDGNLALPAQEDGPPIAEVVGPNTPTLEPTLELARRLAREGKSQEAESILAEIVREVEALRRTLGEGQSTAAAKVRQAENLVAQGRFQEALDLAHAAHRLSPDEPTVFASMMKIHADIGRALDRPEEYESSVHVLNCAHTHDPTDGSIHQALAERHYQRARTMHGQGNRAETLKALQQALKFDPRHAAATGLQQELMRTPPTEAPV